MADERKPPKKGRVTVLVPQERRNDYQPVHGQVATHTTWVPTLVEIDLEPKGE